MASVLPCHGNGFTLLEVMIAAMVMAIGLLGLVAMQASAKFAAYDARQRTLASWLTTDLVERVRINGSAWGALRGQTWRINADTVINRPQCGGGDGSLTGCSAHDLVTLDLFIWQQALLGKTVSGSAASLQDPAGCIMRDDSRGLTVILTWQGRQALRDGTAAIASEIRNRCELTAAATGSRRTHVLVTSL